MLQSFGGGNMSRYIVVGLALLSLLATSSQAAESSPVDPDKAKKAEVVLRIRRLMPAECDKYCWPEVEILEVLQNKSNVSFDKRLKVAHYSWKTGIPEGESTIYLVRFNPEKSDLWKLLNGSGADGVSHVTSPRSRKR
jgi:hypothetical protein